MVDLKDYGSYETAWCPGCGNFAILKALKSALAAMDLHPHEVLIVSGIGQAAKTPQYLNVNMFNGLHGRSLPVATGARIANTDLTVIAESGDGCNYGEGGNHFLAALRRNVNMTLLVHNNQIYGLTKGQASPTSAEGTVTKAQPLGVSSQAFNPILTAVATRANLVARSFAGEPDHVAQMIQQAVRHPGFSIVDVLQPCVSFNRVNTFDWYRRRCYHLPDDYDPSDWQAAMEKADEWNDRIPIGVIYKGDRKTFEEHSPVLTGGALNQRGFERDRLEEILEEFA